VLALGLCARLWSADDALGKAITTLRAVGPEGQGNAEAAAAARVAAAASLEELMVLLAGMDGASDRSLNWLRAASEAAVDRAMAAGQPLPVAELGAFVVDTHHHPKARQFAYELLARADPATAAVLLPGFLNDPSLALRRDAVERLVQEAPGAAAAGRKDGAVVILRQALAYARDADQVQSIAARLREMGQGVDLPGLFGFLTRWKLIGPFDNTGRSGFGQAYPPERELEFGAEYDGKSGKVRWIDHVSKNEEGKVDVNPVFGPLKEVTAYAFGTFMSDEARPAEIRLGCKNGWKLWFNGAFVFGRDEYHRAMEIDQYRFPVTLRAGKNTMLIKLCQNEQVEDWTVEWEFQLRITDALGTPLRESNPTPAKP
jgi:hypothetical protein